MIRPPLAALLLSVLSGSVTWAAAPADPSDPGAAFCTTPGEAVHEELFVRIGGIEQWVTIKGERCSNPIVLFLHGGPGNPMSPYSDPIYGAWARDFTLVQWDQRGAGRTFGRHRPGEESPLTPEQMARDGVELAAYLARTLGQKKIILLGGSWGSALGVHMVKARPELFHAYLGAGQIVRYAENQASSYSKLQALVTEASDAETLSALQALGPPPWSNPRGFGTVRRATRRYEAKVTTAPPASWWKRPSAYATPEQLADDEAGEDYSYLQFVGLKGDGMFSRIDLPALGTRFEVPMYFVQGAEDLVTTAEVAKRYFDSIEAPAKTMCY